MHQVLRRSTGNSVSQYLDYTIEEYHQLVGNNDTLRERFLAHVDYPINDPGQGYVPQELSSHRVELIMSERGLPTLDYLVQAQGHSAAYLGRNARPLIIDRYTLRGLGLGELDNALTTHRLWMCLDYFQYTIFMTTGYVCPNLRSYSCARSQILDHVRRHYLEGELEEFETKMNQLARITHLSKKDSHYDQEPDNEHTPGHFGNLNFHEKHKGALHLWCRFFTRGGKAKGQPSENYRILTDEGLARCFCVGLRFHKCHLKKLSGQNRVTFFNRHYSQYSVATTALSYLPDRAVQPLSGEEVHGRVLRLRTEEVLDSIAIDYQIDSAEYVKYYSVENLWMQRLRDIYYMIEFLAQLLRVIYCRRTTWHSRELFLDCSTLWVPRVSNNSDATILFQLFVN